MSITILNTSIRSPGRPARTILLLAVVAAISIGGCGDGEQTDQPVIVATTSIWGDVVKEIVGDDMDVSVLIPDGVDPHEFSLTARDAAELSEADLVVANGLGLEEGLEDFIGTIEADGGSLLELGPLLDPLLGPDGNADPHVWLDPTRIAVAADLIAARLTEIDPAVDWDQRSDRYRSQLEEADRDIREILEGVPTNRRKLVTNHESLRYFAETYGFEVVAVVIPGGSTLGEPSSADLAQVVAAIQEHQIDVLFAESTNSGALAETVAQEAGTSVEVVTLHPEELEDGEGLVEMLLDTATSVSGALSG